MNKEMSVRSRKNRGDPFVYVIKERHSPIYDCACGRKYLKTRGESQKECLFCLRDIKK